MRKSLSKLFKMHNKKPLLIAGIFVVILVLFIIKTASFYPFLFHLVLDKGVSLKQTDSKINILLLGIGGEGHDGINLTDTIMLASIDPKDNKVSLISVPRDLWFPDLEGSNKKINGAYADGELKRKGGGIIEAKAAVGKITGQEVNYAIRIDFSGFVKAVDIVGGLDINVDNVLDDYAYPISGKKDDPCGFTPEDIKLFTSTSPAELENQEKFSCRYKHLHFDIGLTHMNGETALEFVRSRHATGAEGSDFTRSKRQEKIISAFKNKVLSTETLVNPARIINLYNVLQGSIDTDIKQYEFDDFVRLANSLKTANIKSAIIDTGDEQSKRAGLLIYAPISKEYSFLSVLIPRLGNGNFTEIQKYISCIIKTGNCPISVKLQN